MRTPQTQMSTFADTLEFFQKAYCLICLFFLVICQQSQSGISRNLAESQGRTSGKESLLWTE